MAVEIMTPKMLNGMRASSKMAAECLVMVGEHIKAGMTTDDINTLVHNYITERDAYPAPLNYRGFPKSVCTSINDCVCHGIPDGTVLKDGDIVNVDVTTYFPSRNGFHGDTSLTFYIGKPSEQAVLVTETARQALEKGLEVIKHGARIGDIGAAITEFAEGRGCSVVRDYVGHGVGREFHMDPQIPHYAKRNTLKRMKAGMVFTVEPMINIGGYQCELLKDEWTVLTADRSLSAQFEHSILVTRGGCEVLTKRPTVAKNSEDLPWCELGKISAPAAFKDESVTVQAVI